MIIGVSLDLIIDGNKSFIFKFKPTYMHDTYGHIINLYLTMTVNLRGA